MTFWNKHSGTLIHQALKNMHKLVLLLAIISPIMCIIVVDRLILTPNEKLVSSNATMYNDRVHDTLFNGVYELLADVQQIFVSLKIDTPEDKDDKKYQRELFRTSINGQKILGGINGNYFTKSIMENLQKSLGFEPTFPIKKGIYRLTNFSVSDRNIPFNLNCKFAVDVRFTAKLVGKKSIDHLYTVEAFGEMKHR